MTITVEINGNDMELDVEVDSWCEAEPDVGITSSYAESYIARCLDTGKELTESQYDSISDHDNETILEQLSEDYINKLNVDHD